MSLPAWNYQVKINSNKEIQWFIYIQYDLPLRYQSFVTHMGVFPNKDFSVCHVLLTWILVFSSFWITKKKKITKKSEYITLFLLYLWAKYETICLNVTGKIVIFSAYWFWTDIYYFRFTKNQSFDGKIQSYGLIFCNGKG